MVGLELIILWILIFYFGEYVYRGVIRVYFPEYQIYDYSEEEVDLLLMIPGINIIILARLLADWVDLRDKLR